MYSLRIYSKLKILNKNPISNLRATLASIRSLFTGHDLTTYRSLFKIKGKDAPVYLQNLITNDINRLSSPETKSIYSMMLNNRGRVLYDVIIYRLNIKKTELSTSDQLEYLIEVDTKHVTDFLKLLNIYKLRKNVEISNMSNEFKLFALINEQEDTNEELILNSDNQNDLIHCDHDPRFIKLGYRVILPNKNLKLSDYIKNSNQIVDNRNLLIYKKNLYKYGIAENHDDITYGSSIPLEYNLVLLDGVSFSKGCYLGQELIAKIHHTGVVRKRIMPIYLKDSNENCSFKIDTEILNKNGQSVGKLKNFIENNGIAMLRLEKLEKDLFILDNLNKSHSIGFKVPDYWNRDSNLIKSLKVF